MFVRLCGGMGKGEVESWVRAKDAEAMDHRDTVSVRFADSAQDVMAKRPYARDEAAFSDGEDNAGNRWYPHGQGRKGEGVGGAPFSRLDANRSKDRPNLYRSQSAAEGRGDRGVPVFCCCGPRFGGRKASSGAVEGADVLRTKGRWEVDDDDEYYKPPVWKQIIQKVKAQTRHLNSNSTPRGEWVNYDPQSYEKNFDNGTWRDSSQEINHYVENDENKKLGLKERALHTALLQKFASSRSQKLADGEVQLIVTSPALSPLPVRTIPKSKDEFVPIWQRRAASPIKLDVRHRT